MFEGLLAREVLSAEVDWDPQGRTRYRLKARRHDVPLDVAMFQPLESFTVPRACVDEKLYAGDAEMVTVNLHDKKMVIQDGKPSPPAWCLVLVWRGDNPMVVVVNHNNCKASYMVRRHGVMELEVGRFRTWLSLSILSVVLMTLLHPLAVSQALVASLGHVWRRRPGSPAAPHDL